MKFEILIPKRPLSLQAKDRSNLQKWKDYVFGRVFGEWRGTPVNNQELRFTIVYLCNESPADIDNIIKPIQDSFVGVVFSDDSLISDVDSHRRFLSEPIDITNLPPLLQQGVINGLECVYVRVSDVTILDSYL